MKIKFKEFFSVVDSKHALIGALASVFIFLFIFNISFLNFKTNERGLASNLAPSVEKSFIKRLSELEKTEMTRFAHKPTSVDKLRFEVLKGKYSVLQVNNKIQRLRLNIGEEGVNIKKPEEFLNEYRGLLISEESSFQRLEGRTFKRDISSSVRIESFEVVEKDQLRGRLDFEFDEQDSLLEVQMHWL